MKKLNKLNLNRETVRRLLAEELDHVQGGATPRTIGCTTVVTIKNCGPTRTLGL